MAPRVGNLVVCVRSPLLCVCEDDLSHFPWVVELEGRGGRIHVALLWDPRCSAFARMILQVHLPVEFGWG